MTRTRYDLFEQSLSIITQGVAGLETQYASQTITTASTTQPDLKHHRKALRAEVRRIASPISHSMIRNAIISAVNEVIEQALPETQQSTGSQSMDVVSDDEMMAGRSESGIYRVDKRRTVQDSGRRAKAQGGKRCRLQALDNVSSGSANKSDLDQQADLKNEIYKTQPVLRRHKRIFRWSTITKTTTFGTISLTSKVFLVQDMNSKGDDESELEEHLIEEECIEQETSFRLHPAQWLLHLGLNCGLSLISSNSMKGWKCTLETYRAVPDNSEIFQCCRYGNLDRVKILLSTGKASFRDTDALGWTPLHVSICS